MPCEDRARFFALLSHNLTVAIRSVCAGGTDPATCLAAARLLNEAHHRVAGYLLHMLAGDEQLAWLTVVVSYVLGSSNPAVHQLASQAWSLSQAALSPSAAA